MGVDPNECESISGSDEDPEAFIYNEEEYPLLLKKIEEETLEEEQEEEGEEADE